MLLGLLMLLKLLVLCTGCPSGRELTSNLCYLPTKLDTLCYHHTYRTFSWTTIQSGNLGHRLPTYFYNQQLLPRWHHEPSLYLSQLYGAHSNMTCLLTLLAHLNVNLRANFSLHLTAARNTTVQRHPAFLIRTLSAT